MEGRILVSTQDLLNASNDFQGSNSTIKDITGQMLALARNLNKQWEGESSKYFISKFNDLEDDMQTIDKLISEHVKDLQEMAQSYENAEKQVSTIAQGVSTTLI